MADPAIQMSRITKSFAGIPVLKGISFDVRPGEVHALLGENGAGKSTLMKILMGVHLPDGGQYLVGGNPAVFKSPAEAQHSGVSMVNQELELVPYLSATENILMGRLPTRFGRVLWREAGTRARAVLDRLGSSVSPDAIVGDLKVADQQEVEIARALSYDPLTFVMDEPSAALSRSETLNLYKLVNVLRRQGVAIVYITHKIHEVFDLTDRVTILRDGTVMGTWPTVELTPSLIVSTMTGRDINLSGAVAAPPSSGENDRQRPLALKVRGLGLKPFFESVSFDVPVGTIVGIAGVVGAGKTELAKTIVGAMGARTETVGTLAFGEKTFRAKDLSPRKARALGVGLVTEDRQSEGFVPGQSVKFNTVLPALARVSRFSVIDRRKTRDLVAQSIEEVRLRPPDLDKRVETLSGGNQQKVVISKWLAAKSKVILLDEPTRGIDVGAREEIYGLMRRRAGEGNTAVVVLSSDMRELLIACDVILVMKEGRITERVLPWEVTEQDLVEKTTPRTHDAATSGEARA